ncbi:MAG: thiamine diphosphokinase [Fimbriimonas sp.]
MPEFAEGIAAEAAPARVLGVLAGNDLPIERVAIWAFAADLVLAADGGANTLLRANIRPHVLVGDMDSATDSARDFAHRAEADPDQETTDCDKLLALAFRLGARSITLAGVEGDRLDHVLATIHSSARSPLRVQLLLRMGVGLVLNGPTQIEVPAQVGAKVSLLPVTDCEGVSLSGVEWPLQSAVLHPMGMSSISNRATEAVVRVGLGSGVAVLFVEQAPETRPDWGAISQFGPSR